MGPFVLWRTMDVSSKAIFFCAPVSRISDEEYACDSYSFLGLNQVLMQTKLVGRRVQEIVRPLLELTLLLAYFFPARTQVDKRSALVSFLRRKIT